MTNFEMKNIADEITYIDQQLSILDPDNLIENQQRERLLCRLDFLEYKIDCFLLSKKRSHLRLISS